MTTAVLHRAALAVRWIPPWVDVALALAFVAFTVAEAVLNPEVPSVGRHLALTGSAMLALAWRRRFPLLVAVVVVLAHAVGNPQGEFSVLLSLVLVSFTLGFEAEPRAARVGLVVVLVPFAVGTAAEGLEPSDLAAALVFLVGPWAVGVAARQRATRSEEAVARAARAEAEGRRLAEQAVADERTRIARELHDIVSHSLSVIAISTQAVRRRLPPDRAAEAADLAAVETTAREALAEMRRLFGMLRAEGEEAALAPQPGVAELPRLVAALDAPGRRVTLEADGEPGTLTPGMDLALYRIAQEGLTNAVRHSGATNVTVRLRYAPDAVEVEVADDGAGLPGGGPDPARGGHGLVGVRERAALYGGRVTLGPGPGGGTTLRAVLPRGPHGPDGAR